MALDKITSSQQARIEVAQKRVLDASNYYNNAADIARLAEADSQACQSARDSKSTSIGKNNACSLDTLSRLNNEWDLANKNRDLSWNALEAAKADLATVLATIEKENQLAAGALKNDPAFNLATQANILASDALQNQADRDRNKKIIFIVGMIILAGVIGVSIWYLIKKKKVSA